MSLLIDKEVKKYQSVDERINVNRARGYIVLKGAANSTPLPVITQAYSDNQVVFNVIPPSSRTIIGRRVILKYPMRFTLTGPDASTPLVNLSDGSFSLRCLPISSVTSSMTLTLNNSTFTFAQINEVIHEVERYDVDAEETFQAGSGLLLQDNYQRYSDALGASNNPMNAYGSSEYFNTGRGAFNALMTASVNTNTAATIDVDVYEELYLSPLIFSPKEGPGFLYLNNVTMNMQLSTLSRMISSSQTFTTISGTIRANPSIHLDYLTPQMNDPLPKEVPYSFSQIQPYLTTQGTVTAGSEFTVQANSIQLGSVPDAIMIFARPTLSTLTYQTPDVNAYLKSISINMGNKSGLLASADAYQLYQIAKKNGLKSVNWPMWSKQSGSVLLLRPDQDLSLDPTVAPGLNGYNGNLTVQATFKNISPLSINYTMYIVVVTSGVVTIYDNQQVVQQTGVLTPQDVLESGSLPFIPSDQVVVRYGSGIWDSIKAGYNWIKNNKLVSKGAKLASSVLPPQYGAVAAQIGEVADKLGYGLVGGKKVTKAQLAKIMAQL